MGVYLSFQSYSVRANASNMTQEQIRKQIEVLYKVAEMTSSRKANRQWLRELGLIEAPRQKKKAKKRKK